MGVKEQVLELIAYAEEQEWFEFKENWFEPEALGEYIAALSNAAALLGKKYAYMVWGIQDITQKIVGTTFNPHIQKNEIEIKCHFVNNKLESNLKRKIYDSLKRWKESSKGTTSLLIDGV